MTVSTYDDIAEWYDNWVGAHALREALMGEVAGREEGVLAQRVRAIWPTGARPSSASTSRRSCSRSRGARKRPRRAGSSIAMPTPVASMVWRTARSMASSVIWR